MSRVCKLVGGALLLVGLAVTLTFAVIIGRDDAYRRADLAYSLNAGNVMYEAEFRGAQVRRAFEMMGGVAGVLLAINGTTLVALGVVAARVANKSS